MKPLYFTSNIHDGSMKSPDRNFATVLPKRRAFLDINGISPESTTLVQVTYETKDFCRYFMLRDTDKGDGVIRDASIQADALVVTEPGHALFLPLADCIAAVIHDTEHGILMLSHLGRQNLEQFGGTKCIDYLVEKHGVDPANLSVWLSPAAGKESYPLYSFDDRSLHDVTIEQLLAAGIKNENMTVSPIDSAADPNYFSHSQFLAGNQQTDGRHAVVAVLR